MPTGWGSGAPTPSCASWRRPWPSRCPRPEWVGSAMNAYVEIIYFYVELVRFVNQILLKYILCTWRADGPPRLSGVRRSRACGTAAKWKTAERHDASLRSSAEITQIIKTSSRMWTMEEGKNLRHQDGDQLQLGGLHSCLVVLSQVECLRCQVVYLLQFFMGIPVENDTRHRHISPNSLIIRT